MEGRSPVERMVEGGMWLGRSRCHRGGGCFGGCERGCRSGCDHKEVEEVVVVGFPFPVSLRERGERKLV